MRVRAFCHLCGLVALSCSSPLIAQSSTETYTYDALGRLVEAETAGGQNQGESHSLCYDPAGNRLRYKATSDGSAAPCVDTGSGSSGGGTTPPPPPPPSGNSPPSAVSDNVSGPCYSVRQFNLTGNDTDPEGHYPLRLISIDPVAAYGSAAVISASSVSIELGPSGDVSTYAYTVQDALGAAATGQVTVSVPPCNIVEP